MTGLVRRLLERREARIYRRAFGVHRRRDRVTAARIRRGGV